MPIEVVSSRNLNQPSQNSQGVQSSQNSRTSQNFQNLDFENYSQWVFPEVPERASTKLKLGVLASTLVGVAAGLAVIMKIQNVPLNLSKLFKGNFKEFGLWKVEYNKARDILIVGAGSVLGGLLGGLALDKKENRKAKLRESVIQFIGNMSIPIGCVAAGITLGKKYKPFLQKEVSKINIGKVVEKVTDNKAVKQGAEKTLKVVPKAIITIIALTTGIFAGNKVGNLINEKIFHVKDNRKLKPTDMSPHVDDVCFALTMAEEGSKDGAIHWISRIIPAALTISGYSVGVTKERPERIRHEKQQHDCKTQ